MNNKKYYLSMVAGIAACIIYGFSFIFSKIALEITTPNILLSLRFVVAFLGLELLRLFRIIKINYKGKSIGKLVLLGIFQPILYFVFEANGLRYASASIAGILIALIPIIVLVLGIIFLKEIPTVKQIIYIIISVLGVLLIVSQSSDSGGSKQLLGVALVFGAALSASSFSVLSRKISDEFTSVERTYMMLLVGMIYFVALALFELRNTSIIDTVNSLKNVNLWISVGYLGVISSIIAFLFNNIALTNLEASKCSSFTNLTTVVSVLAGVFILKDTFNSMQVVGTMLIVFGLWGVNKPASSQKTMDVELSSE